MDNELINKAYLFALEKHKDQKYGDRDFIYHLLQTYEILTLLQPEDTTLRASAFTHDIFEDTKTSRKELENELGKEIMELTEEVTATSRNFFPNLKTVRGAILLTASRLANMTNMQNWSEERRKEYVFTKTHYWLP